MQDEIIEYVTADGHCAAILVMRAESQTAPLLLCLPAMGVSAAYYRDFGMALSKSGVWISTQYGPSTFRSH